MRLRCTSHPDSRRGRPCCRETQGHSNINIPTTNRDRTVGIAALTGLMICWAFVPVLLRDLSSSIDAWTANGIRYPLSAVLYWPVLWFAYRKRLDTGERKLNRRVILACLIPAMFSTLGQFFWASAHYHLQASQIGFLIRATTIVTIVGSMILFADERRLLREWRFYLGLLLSIGGFVALSLSGGTTLSSANTMGLTIMLFCSLCFGSYILSVRKCIPDVDPILSFAVVAQVCSIVLSINMFAIGDYSVLATLGTREWILIFASSLLGIGVGHVLLYIAVVRLGASVTTTCQSLMPFLTAAIASVMLGEALTQGEWVAGIVIVAGALTLLSIKDESRDS